MWIRILTPQG
ncbi:unnamed protein product [Fusarium venenatum]|uniref:Uncharacterized protein n=1 Tax=Fusarium venenatum TaxID=56646 RepID=A0A2L2TW79_9HYPO|nr:unnamed protein product [Fusarium venenatum]